MVHIIKDSFGIDNNYSYVKTVYKTIHQVLCREYGKFKLIDGRYSENDKENVLQFFLHTTNIDQALDVIELSFRVLNNHIKDNYQYNSDARPKINVEQAIEELNQRFKEHGIGFQFIEKEIIKVDSTYTHSEIVRPTISLL